MEEVRLLLIHKSIIFSEPIWYDGVIHVNTVAMSPVQATETKKTIVLTNTINKNELTMEHDKVTDEFVVVQVNGIEKNGSVVKYINELRAYREKLIISLLTGKADFGLDQVLKNDLSKSAVQLANNICTEMFNEKFN